jgi:hypothetical protein
MKQRPSLKIDYKSIGIHLPTQTNAKATQKRQTNLLYHSSSVSREMTIERTNEQQEHGGSERFVSKCVCVCVCVSAKSHNVPKPIALQKPS